MNRPRIASLLSTGLKPGQVATIIGVTPARISQLMQEESFKLLLADKAEEVNKTDIEETSLSAKYSAAEHALIAQVMEMAPMSELRDVTAALRVVGDRQEKMKTRIATPLNSVGVTNQVVVSITLPNHAVPSRTFEMTTNKEVISIGDQTLAPLSSTAVTNLFSSLKNQKEGLEQIEQQEGEYHEQSSSIAEPKESIAANLQEEIDL